MSSEARNEFDAEYDDRVRKIRKVAAIALKELDQLRSFREKHSMQRSRASHERSSSRTDAISLFVGWMMASRDS
jgi:hypothetical protein